MFTGIIECVGRVAAINKDQSNLEFLIEAPFTEELKVDQSVAHNGVCLTVSGFHNKLYSITAIAETLGKTTLGQLKINDAVNLERCMVMNGRIDGHIVQGHVDQTATCVDVSDQKGSWLFTFEYDISAGNLTVEKGSVCVNGVSLTVVNSMDNRFSVAIIPYTYEHTNFKQLKKGDQVNLEFDVIGKYVRRYLDHFKHNA
jgi:riboflavin synthase